MFCQSSCNLVCFFFFNDTATTEIYTLSLHDALPICRPRDEGPNCGRGWIGSLVGRSEEHTSELKSHSDLVCRLLLEKKKKKHLLDQKKKKKKKKKQRKNTKQQH